MEELQRMTEAPLTRCPRCKKNTLKKLIGSGSGFIFKGSGFYETDYKKKTARKTYTAKESKAAESSAEKPPQKKEAKSKKK
jgi:putative FmdB family regulatory protein